MTIIQLAMEARVPTIISSSKLRNEYNAVAEECHATGKPILKTENGNRDLAIMSMETYERLTAGGMAELLYGLLDEGHDDVEARRTRPASEAIADLRQRLQE